MADDIARPLHSSADTENAKGSPMHAPSHRRSRACMRQEVEPHPHVESSPPGFFRREYSVEGATCSNRAALRMLPRDASTARRM
jgi:hypothetical protein